MRFDIVTQRRFSPVGIGIFGALVAAVLSFVGGTAGAISNIAPDPSEYGSASGSVGLTLDNTPSSPGVTTIRLPLYVNTLARPGTVTVGMTMVYRASTRISACVTGASGTYRTNITADTSFSVPSGDFAWDAINQLWRATITVSMCSVPPPADGNSFNFRLVAPGSMNFGYTPPGGGGYFSTDNLNGGSGFANYSLEFATPCDIHSNTTNTITLYDLDDGNDNNNYGRVTASIDDVTFGAPVGVPITTSGAMSSGENYRITMMFQPKHKYRLRVNNIYWWNVLQYRMPYDNIAYAYGCPDYSIVPTSVVKKLAVSTGAWVDPTPPGEVRPGDWVRWTHTITGESGGWYGRTVGYEYGCSNGAATLINNSPARSVTMGMALADAARSVNDPATGNCGAPYRVRASDAGKRLCHWITLPIADQNGTRRSSTPSCVTVMAGVVTPKLTFNPDSATIIDGAELRVVFGVTNNTSPPIPAQVCYRARIWYERSLPANTTYDGADVQYYTKASTGCGGGSDGYENIAPDGVSHPVTSDSRPVDITRGGRICAEWLIGSVTIGVGTATPNPLVQCITIGKHPTFQVWGNDLRAGSSLVPTSGQNSAIRGNLISSPSSPARYFGTWGEYSLVAPNDIGLVASGSGLANGNADGVQSAWSRLTFANTLQYGNFTTNTGMGTIPNIAGYLSRPGLNLAGVTRSSVGTVTIGNGPGQTAPASLLTEGNVLISSGTVTIADNLVYPGVTSEATMSQLVIIAPRIDIQGNVAQVDAWLVAADSTGAGTINTCSDIPATAPLSTTICSTPLTINGALTANRLFLRRTAGADRTSLSQPAEVLNLRGDAYIWAYNMSAKNGTWTTRSVTELPPRY